MENAVTPRNVLEFGINKSESKGTDFVKCEDNINRIR